MKSARPFALSLVAGVVFFVALHAALRWFGDSFVSFRLRADGSTASVLGAILALATLAAVLGLLVERAKARAVSAIFVVGFALAATRSFFEQRNASLARFGAVLTSEPDSSFVDAFPNRPPIRYQSNEHGFRGPSWSYVKEPGVVRVVLVGDSFVYGSGVEWESTLGESLAALLRARSPSERFEVLNLGIGGDNLVSHVAVVEEATARLSPDLIVLCLTLPNDLNDDDDQRTRELSSRRSSFNAARWAFGSFFANMLWSSQSDIAGPSSGISVLDRQAKRLDLARSRIDAPPRLIVFTYFDYAHTNPEASVMLSRIRGVTKVISEPDDPSLYIPKDGHPTARGNRVFAGLIADAIRPSPSGPSKPEDQK